MDWNERTGKRIKLRDLYILRAAIEAGSMARAAGDLAITQPAVSYAVAELEHALGVPLLERSSQGVTPTVYGRALLARSRVVFNELRQGMDEIASLADPSVGVLRIGTTPPMSAIASAVFNRLVGAYPRLQFALTVGATDLLLEALREREIELAVSRLADFVSDDDLDVEVLFHDELAVICSKHSKWARKSRVSLRDLIDEPWVLPHAKGFLTKVIRAAFADEGLEVPRPTVTTQSTYALSVLVANGPFLAMHPRTMLTIPRAHPQLTAVNLQLRGTSGPIGLITLKHRPLSPVARLFLDTAAGVVKAKPQTTPQSARKLR